MPFSDWLRYSRSIKQLDYELEISSLCCRSAHEAELDESFERLVDLY